MGFMAQALSSAVQGWMAARGLRDAPPPLPGGTPGTDLFDGAQPTFLHVGCGGLRSPHVSPGLRGTHWREVRLDIDPGVAPDIVASITDMEGVPNASVDVVYSAHNLEHLYPHEVPLALREFRRVLKPDGLLVATCPDLESVCRRLVEGGAASTAYTSEAGPIAPLDMLFGLRSALADGRLPMAHRFGFTAQTLADAAQAAGFGGALCRARPERYDLWLLATRRPEPMHRLQALADEHWPA